MKLKRITSVLLLFCVLSLFSQDKVLVFTKTNGFSHPSIEDGIAMIEKLGRDNGLWSTDQTSDSSAFTDNNLSQYRAVIWCNTSGNNLLNQSQQAAFEDYIKNGGGFVGIHAATDTYRDRSWPFYNELVGGIVRTMPNHTSQNFEAIMQIINPHPSVDFLGDSWTKKEEYYYWEGNGGFLFDRNIPVLEVESTGSEPYDKSRPIAWYKEYQGGRSFYTALGHNRLDYIDNTNFIKHVEEGIKYAIGVTLNVDSVNPHTPEITLLNNPVNNVLTFSKDSNSLIEEVHVYTLQGVLAISKENIVDTMTFNISSLSSGLYLAEVLTKNRKQVFKFIKE
ncbi:ThuA domain-containing protein [Aquimarina sp. ERC-38]|uniref:ThuA domain-containing protein n=1 Tax=Aquimarina sp. ERC-38 TaxID=2949996 RepID=UPI002247D38C|nr:ThuA domain-containing protein [Aquimarina sp. ERC-38]UZO79331.1 ThuA domain-containing protein [Aquimarina sp. ERC-38]